jgi:hypothetical protein
VTVEPVTLPNALAGTSYRQQLTASSAAGGPFAFAVTSGELPAGLTLSSGGTLSGTPAGPGQADFTVTATDADFVPGSRRYSLTVDRIPLVVAGPLTTRAGVPAAFRATATAPGHPDTDVTSETTFAIEPAEAGSGASCTANSCTATRAGAYTVTGSFAGASGNTSLTVVTTVTKTSGSLRDARTGMPINRSCVVLRSVASDRSFIVDVAFGRWSLQTEDPGPFQLGFFTIQNKNCSEPALDDRYLPSWYQNQPFTGTDPRAAVPPASSTAVDAGSSGIVACLARTHRGTGQLPTTCASPDIRFFGHVLRGRLHPINLACIVVLGQNGPPAGQAIADADGRWTVLGLPVDHPLVVRAFSPFAIGRGPC